MMPNLDRIFSETLTRPTSSLIWELSREVTQAFPDRYLLETEDYDFNLDDFEEDRQCVVYVLDDLHPQLDAEWYGGQKGVRMKPRTTYVEVHWRGHRLHIVTLTYNDGCDTNRHLILAESEAVARAFFAAVCAHSIKVTGQILVFCHGSWQKDRDLMEQIAVARMEDLVLPDGMREGFARDIEGFFASQQLYRDLGVAWKRGMLLVGPPGNGKTHAIKAMVQRLSVPCLYVRSFTSERKSPQRNVESVFARARSMAPCMLILEDLDSLVDPKWLSFFLNEMDGFAANQGILTIGTTNHPEKLDPALLERPSRFDRKVLFPLPGREQRRQVIANLDAKRADLMRLTEAEIDVLAQATEGFSVAFLKELHISSTMAWMVEQRPGGMGDVAQGLVETLRKQMGKEMAATPAKPDDDEEDDDNDDEDGQDE